MTDRPVDPSERIREFELLAVRRHMPERGKLLEIGGGTGYQASIIQSWGYEVSSVDVAIPTRANFFPVSQYDGKHLPFPDRHFDIVFSSHVLEHVRDVEGLLEECRRVLAPGGVMIHVMPTATWRLWTSVFHYAFLFKRFVLRKPHKIPAVDADPTVGSVLRKHGFIGTIRRVLMAPPHGEYRNAVVELYTYTDRRWSRLFARAGFKNSSFGLRVFYSGYGMLPAMGIQRRIWMSRLLGSSSRAFIVSPSNHEENGA